MAALQCEFCGGKLITKAGGICECDSCGMEFDKTWVKEKIQEIKGTVKVEGNVEVTGSVKVDGAVEVKGSVSKESLLKRAQLALEDRDWKSAADYFEKVLDVDPECTEAYFGLAMCEAEANTLEALVNAEKWDNKNYIKGKRFASPALLAQVEQLEQAYLQRKREEEEKARIAEEEARIAREKREEEERIAREKWEEEDRIAREKSKRQLGPIRDRLRKAACLMETGGNHTVGLKADGTVVVVGHNYGGQRGVNDWRDIVKVCAGQYHTVGLKADGTVVATDPGRNHCINEGQSNVSSWRDIVQVNAGEKYTVGLKADGTVVAVGNNDYGQCDVSSWQDIVQMSAGRGHTVGLKADGTVVAVGENTWGRCDVSGWRDIVQVSAGDSHTVGLKADGTVVATEHIREHYFGECDVSEWRDIVQVSACQYCTVGLKADGTLVAVGYNVYDQCDVSDWRLFRHLDTLEQERIACERRDAGLCQHCGGTFKGLFTKKCVACGKPKDY